jgi:hypothetical protein
MIQHGDANREVSVSYLGPVPDALTLAFGIDT